MKEFSQESHSPRVETSSFANLRRSIVLVLAGVVSGLGIGYCFGSSTKNDFKGADPANTISSSGGNNDPDSNPIKNTVFDWVANTDKCRRFFAKTAGNPNWEPLLSEDQILDEANAIRDRQAEQATDRIMQDLCSESAANRKEIREAVAKGWTKLSGVSKTTPRYDTYWFAVLSGAPDSDGGIRKEATASLPDEPSCKPNIKFSHEEMARDGIASLVKNGRYFDALDRFDLSAINDEIMDTRSEKGLDMESYFEALEEAKNSMRGGGFEKKEFNDALCKFWRVKYGSERSNWENFTEGWYHKGIDPELSDLSVWDMLKIIEFTLEMIAKTEGVDFSRWEPCDEGGGLDE